MASVLLLKFLLVCFLSLCSAQQHFVPFSEFLRSTRKATYQDFAATPVRDEYAFLEIRKHVLDMYGGVAAPANVRSYLSGQGYTDCLLFSEQPSIHLLNLTEEERTPPPVDEQVDLPDLGGATDGIKGQPIAVSLFYNGPQEAVDVFGNPRRCVNGTVPQSRLTLDRITRYGTLYNFLSKRPLNFTAAWYAPNDANNTGPVTRQSARDVGRSVDGYKHLHEVGRAVGEGFLGAGASLNAWNPRGGFSLSQMWLINEGRTQTIEAGWVVGGPADDDDGGTYPFIYHTNGSYAEGTGCYNDLCGGFVRAPAPAYPLQWDREIRPVSTLGGGQRELRLLWRLVGSQWRLYVPNPLGPSLVGWYPTSLYRTGEGQLSQNAYYIEFGGEVADDVQAWETYGEMGSGRLATEDYVESYRQAAYQRTIMRIRDRDDDTRERWLPATLIPITQDARFPDETADRCYNSFVKPNILGAPAGWGTSMFFGGPGGVHCDDLTGCLALGCPPRCRIIRVCAGNPRCTDPTPEDDPPCCPANAAENNLECERRRYQCRAHGCRAQ